MKTDMVFDLVMTVFVIIGGFFSVKGEIINGIVFIFVLPFAIHMAYNAIRARITGEKLPIFYKIGEGEI